jgi:hypothetical protein
MIAIGHYIGNTRQSYWTPAKLGTDILFWGKYSEISGGEMPNKVVGSVDHLDIAGVTGSETYTCPNDALYIAADTDKLWINYDSTIRAATTANLVGYDFARTFVKYSNSAPYVISEIVIIKSTTVIDQTFKDNISKYMSLWEFYFTVQNLNGFPKENRPSSTWINVPADLSDGGTKFLLDYTLGVTQVANLVSSWADMLGGGVALVEAHDTEKPTLDLDGSLDADGILDDGIIFDGVDNRLSASFAWVQPEMVYIVMKVLSWTINDILFDGGVSHSGKSYQTTATPTHSIAAGIPACPISYTLNKWIIVRAYFSGVNSYHILNNAAPVTGNAGTIDMAGFTLGSRFQATNWGNVKVKGVCGRTSNTGEVNIYNYLKARYGL